MKHCCSLVEVHPVVVILDHKTLLLKEPAMRALSEVIRSELHLSLHRSCVAVAGTLARAVHTVHPSTSCPSFYMYQGTSQGETRLVGAYFQSVQIHIVWLQPGTIVFPFE